MNFPLLHFLGEYSYFLQCGLQITYIGITQGECGVQLLSRVQLFATPWAAARQASLSFTISWSLLRFMSIESMMLSNHLILCHRLLLLSSIFPSIWVFSNELTYVKTHQIVYLNLCSLLYADCNSTKLLKNIPSLKEIE